MATWLAVAGWIVAGFAGWMYANDGSGHEEFSERMTKVVSSLYAENVRLKESADDKDAVIIQKCNTILQKNAELARIGVTRGADGRLKRL